MQIKDITKAFEMLGIFLEQFGSEDKTPEIKDGWLNDLNNIFFESFESEIKQGTNYNGWFSEENIRFAIQQAANMLTAENISGWLSCYGIRSCNNNTQKTIAVIMAGNIPMAGLHDFISVLVSENKILAKLSSKDNRLLRAIAAILCHINPNFSERIIITEERLKNFDAVIATGGDNSSRYFEHYFGKYPNIIRKNRNSAAIITGNETSEQLKLLANDIFLYFGLGCRSVSKLYIPKDYDPASLSVHFEKYYKLIDHNHWANNYIYQKAIAQMSNKPHIDCGFFLMREDPSFTSPVSVINYEVVDTPKEAIEKLEKENDRVQCVTGDESLLKIVVPFGNAQKPKLTDYADGIDTLKFLYSIK